MGRSAILQRIENAARRRDAADSDHRAAMDELRDACRVARANGWTWQQIANAAGVSRPRVPVMLRTNQPEGDE